MGVNDNVELKGLSEQVPTFGTYGVSVTLLRLADRSPLAQRWVLARARCIQANGHDTRRDTVLQSSAATLPKSSAATAVRTEIASQRSSLLQTSGCHGRLMAGNNHTGTASCPGAAASSRCLCSSSSPLAAARRVRSAGSTLVRELNLKEHRTFDCEELFSSGLHSGPRATRAGFTAKERTDGIAPCACSFPSAVLCSHYQRNPVYVVVKYTPPRSRRVKPYLWV